MKHLIPALLIVLCICSSGFTGEWRPYVGVGGVADQPIPFHLYNFPQSMSGEWLPITVSFGTEFEVGIQKQRSEFYLAYHTNNSFVSCTTYGTSAPVDFWTWISSVEYEQTSWEERRGLIGYRYRFKSQSPVTPIIGTAISLGRSTFREYYSERTTLFAYDTTTHEETITTLDSYHYSRKSDRPLRPGIMVESGIEISIYKTLSFQPTFQTHFFSMRRKVGNIWAMEQDYAVVVPTLQLQLRYAF